MLEDPVAHFTPPPSLCQVHFPFFIHCSTPFLLLILLWCWRTCTVNCRPIFFLGLNIAPYIRLLFTPLCGIKVDTTTWCFVEKQFSFPRTFRDACTPPLLFCTKSSWGNPLVDHLGRVTSMQLSPIFTM